MRNPRKFYRQAAELARAQFGRGV